MRRPFQGISKIPRPSWTLRVDPRSSSRLCHGTSTWSLRAVFRGRAGPAEVVVVREAGPKVLGTVFASSRRSDRRSLYDAHRNHGYRHFYLSNSGVGPARSASTTEQPPLQTAEGFEETWSGRLYRANGVLGLRNEKCRGNCLVTLKSNGKCTFEVKCQPQHDRPKHLLLRAAEPTWDLTERDPGPTCTDEAGRGRH